MLTGKCASSHYTLTSPKLVYVYVLIQYPIQPNQSSIKLKSNLLTRISAMFSDQMGCGKVATCGKAVFTQKNNKIFVISFNVALNLKTPTPAAVACLLCEVESEQLSMYSSTCTKRFFFALAYEARHLQSAHSTAL